MKLELEGVGIGVGVGNGVGAVHALASAGTAGMQGSMALFVVVADCTNDPVAGGTRKSGDGLIRRSLVSTL